MNINDPQNSRDLAVILKDLPIEDREKVLAAAKEWEGTIESFLQERYLLVLNG